MALKAPFRLRYLRIKPRRAAEGEAGACSEEVRALLACWRTNGVDAPACAPLAAALAQSSAAAALSAKRRTLQPSVNYALNRIFSRR